VSVNYLVFDILNLDGQSLLRRGYDERRVLLEQTVTPDARSAVQVPAAFAGDFEAAYAASARLGLEGVMAKKHDSTYTAGKRSRSWIKVKHHLTQEVVIGGWRPGAGRRADGVGSLLLGVPEKGGLRYVGRVGTGFSDADLTSMGVRFEKLARKTSPFMEVPRDVERDARWLKPELVGEVEFAEWTGTGILRQPSWRGWRTDKSAADVVRES
jgi:bifunctional non-homologous end joining protein LigD